MDSPDRAPCESTERCAPDGVAHTPPIDEIAAALANAGFGGIPLTDLERAAIANALAATNGNRTHAANLLGVSVRTLQRKLKDGLAEPGRGAGG